MEKYDNYKDSGIEWIGEIPQHWEVKKIKQFTNILTGSTPKSTEETYWNGDINWVTTDDLGKLKTKDIIESRRQITEKGFNSSGTYLAPVDSIVLSTRAPIGHIGILKIEACTNQGCKTIIANKKFDSVFLYYYLHSGKSFLNSLGVGTTFVELPTQSLKDFTVPFPTPEEQTAIANYLDRKTAEIDELIADKKRLLELYEEEKTAIINKAVTKGINPNVPMKDSGIEWLGEIPGHWEVKRLSWCFDIIGSGTTPKAGSEEYYFNGEFNWLLTGDLTDGDILETSKKVTQKALDDYSSLKKYPINSIVMAMYGATIGKLGILKITTTVNQACCVLGNPIHLHYQFAFFLLLAARKEIINMSYGGGQPNISQELIKSFRVQVPPLEEQKAIVQYIETETARINQKVAKTEKLIELLSEYRTVLISEVVTGKIKVTL